MKFHTYNGETEEDQVKYFNYIYTRLGDLGFNLKFSKELFEEGKAITATIDIGKRYFGVCDTRIIGYSFCSSFPNKHLLSLKRMAENFDELVLKHNKELLDALYTIEYYERTGLKKVI
jgi:hypothetical protein